MTQITVPIRLPQEEYKHYKRIAFEGGKSFAQLVREALRMYQVKEVDRKLIEKRVKLAKRLWKSRIPIDIPIVELIHSGRRFEK